MPHYLLSVIQPVTDHQPSPEFLEKVTRDVTAYHEELQKAGAWVFSGGLAAPSSATVIKVKDGEMLLTDGPYAEGKEYVGGFSIVKAPDLDAALEWGRKAARATTLPIEVRPFHGVFDA